MYIIFLGIIFFLLLLYLLTKYSSGLLLIDKPDNRKIHKEPVPKYTCVNSWIIR